MAREATAVDIKVAAAFADGVSNVSAYCRENKITRQTFYKWRARFAAEGVDGLRERSRSPGTVSNATSAGVEDRVVRLRKELLDAGKDHGPEAIFWVLMREADIPDEAVPSRTTIWRILHRRGLITAQPRKRPKSSTRRFTASRPNELWQSDWTGWQLADGTRWRSREPSMTTPAIVRR